MQQRIRCYSEYINEIPDPMSGGEFPELRNVGKLSSGGGLPEGTSSVMLGSYQAAENFLKGRAP
jgi:hypothetical protein